MEREYLGRSGDVGGYRLEVEDDRLRVLKEGVVVLDHVVPPHAGRSIGRFVAEAGDLRLAWGRLPVGDEAIAISDAAAGTDEALSYVVNIGDPGLSGWGHGLGLLAAAETEEGVGTGDRA